MKEICSEFEKNANSKGYKIKKKFNSKAFNYVDFFLEGLENGKPKSLKVFFKKKSKNKKFIWIEIKNNKGQPGWIFGDSDIVIFETHKSYILIDRKKIINFYMNHSYAENLKQFPKTIESKNKEKLSSISISKLKKISIANWEK